MFYNIIMKKFLLINIVFFCVFICFSLDKFYQKRMEMVKYQIEARGVKNKKVLDAMKAVLRHKFVPEKIIEYSYDDRPLPIGNGQTISQPYIVALMTDLLGLKSDYKVLEIGTGSGYQAAVLSKIIKEVYTVEIYKELSDQAKKRFEDFGYNNIYCMNADGYYGWEDKGPFDAIIVTCAAGYVPPPLIKQLKVGGVLVIPVGEPFRVQNLLLIRKVSEEKIITEIITEVIFVPLLRKE